MDQCLEEALIALGSHIGRFLAADVALHRAPAYYQAIMKSQCDIVALTRRTIKDNLKAAMRKLRCRNRAETRGYPARAAVAAPEGGGALRVRRGARSARSGLASLHALTQCSPMRCSIVDHFRSDSWERGSRRVTAF
jgi:hypothetical protein